MGSPIVANATSAAPAGERRHGRVRGAVPRGLPLGHVRAARSARTPPGDPVVASRARAPWPPPGPVSARGHDRHQHQVGLAQHAHRLDRDQFRVARAHAHAHQGRRRSCRRHAAAATTPPRQLRDTRPSAGAGRRRARPADETLVFAAERPRRGRGTARDHGGAVELVTADGRPGGREHRVGGRDRVPVAEGEPGRSSARWRRAPRTSAGRRVRGPGTAARRTRRSPARPTRPAGPRRARSGSLADRSAACTSGNPPPSTRAAGPGRQRLVAQRVHGDHVGARPRSAVRPSRRSRSVNAAPPGDRHHRADAAPTAGVDAAAAQAGPRPRAPGPATGRGRSSGPRPGCGARREPRRPGRRPRVTRAAAGRCACARPRRLPLGDRHQAQVPGRDGDRRRRAAARPAPGCRSRRARRAGSPRAGPSRPG